MLFHRACRFETSSSVVTALSVTLGCVSVFVSVRRFGEDSTDKCLGVVFFFFSDIRLNGRDVPDACILFGVFGVDLQCHG